MTDLTIHRSKRLSDYLTIEEAVAQSGYAEQYVRRMASSGRLRAIKRGHFWLIERESLENYLQAAQESPDRRCGPRYPELMKGGDAIEGV